MVKDEHVISMVQVEHRQRNMFPICTLRNGLATVWSVLGPLLFLTYHDSISTYTPF